MLLDVHGHTNMASLSGYEQHASRLRTSLQKARDHAIVNDMKAKDAQKRHYDSTISEEDYKPGDRVLLHSPAVPRGQSSKLYLPWVGPYVVLKKLPNNVYRIQEETGKRKRRVVHHNRLKRVADGKEPVLLPARTLSHVTDNNLPLPAPALKDFPDIIITENEDNDPAPTPPAVPDYPDIIDLDLEGEDLYVDAVEHLPTVQAAEDPQLADALENPPLLDILDNELHVDDQAEENGDQGTDGGQHNTPPANDAELLDDDQLPVVLLPLNTSLQRTCPARKAIHPSATRNIESTRAVSRLSAREKPSAGTATSS
ncbi:hypothetical protein HPB47_026751 [Ixodes persulcatus]|uniref:Uncharacterized protein n=1 Tax=Ixodes persulcatus TaxID=34615 RepID=A0AC60PZ15_IXOPE|nr:hypothetical protein HPB47_026751 [Ixodes persulcatus]